MVVQTPICDFGWKPVDFKLKGSDGKDYTLEDVRGPNGTLVMFICNHCPYVMAVIDRIVRDVNELQDLGLGVIAINSNDPEQYPDDSFFNMIKMSQRYNLPFPYVVDETQETARAWDAVCTPDFFGFNGDMELQYRGRLDESRKESAGPDVRRDLYLAMKQVLETGRGPEDQIPSMGCSIKWRLDD